MAVCEAYNEVSRMKEELGLLPKEMQAHMQFYRDLEAKLKQLQAVLAADSTPTLEALQAAGFSVLLGTGRYQPAELVLSSAAVRSGAVTFVRLAHVEVQEQLRVAVKAFASAGVSVDGETEQPDNELNGEEDSEDGDLPAPPDVVM
jgi:hypothetical protein